MSASHWVNGCALNLVTPCHRKKGEHLIKKLRKESPGGSGTCPDGGFGAPDVPQMCLQRTEEVRGELGLELPELMTAGSEVPSLPPSISWFRAVAKTPSFSSEAGDVSMPPWGPTGAFQFGILPGPGAASTGICLFVCSAIWPTALGCACQIHALCWRLLMRQTWPLPQPIRPLPQERQAERMIPDD